MCEAHIAIVHQNSLPPRQAALLVRGLFTVGQTIASEALPQFSGDLM